MPVITFPLPVPQFIQRKLDHGRAKLDACTPLVLLRRRLAEADTGCAPPPSTDDRLSLSMLLERHGRWSTALMCGAVEEVAMGFLVYQNGAVTVCDQSLPKARIAAQKVVLTACNLLLSKSTGLVDRGVDAVQCVKDNTVILTKKVSLDTPYSLPGAAVIRSLDDAFGDKAKANAAVRAFLDARVNARVLHAHACVFDAAENLVRWHKLLRVSVPKDQDDHQLQPLAALRATPGHAKLALQRTWTAASVWALCCALSHASAANMVLAIVMGSGDYEDEELAEEEAKENDDALALALAPRPMAAPTEPQVDVQHTATQVSGPDPAVPTMESSPAAGGSKAKQDDINCEAEDAGPHDEVIKDTSSKRHPLPASFITSQGNRYRVKSQTGSQAQEDDFSSTRRRVVVKGPLQGKGKGSGRKAKQSVLGIKVRVPTERLREGARVQKNREPGDKGKDIEDRVEVLQASEGPTALETETAATQSTKPQDPNAEDLKTPQSIDSNAEVVSSPSANYGTISGSDQKKSLSKGAAEAVGRLSWRLMSTAATVLPDAVVAAGSAVIVRGSSALGLDDALGLQTYYKWEEGPAIIGPWKSRGRWALVADNCPPPPSPPAVESDASACASGEGTGRSGGVGSSNMVNTGEIVSGSKRGAIEGKRETSDEVEIVAADGAKKPTVVDSKGLEDSNPKASVEPPANVGVVCSDVSVPKEAEPSKANESTSKRDFLSPLRLPLDRYPRPRLSWFALQAGLQSVRDVLKSVRGRGVDLWQDETIRGEAEDAGAEEDGTHSSETCEQEKSKSASPASGTQEGNNYSLGEKDVVPRTSANAKDTTAKGALNEADAGHDSISEEQAVEELLQGEKEESAADHGDAGEEFKQNSTEIVGGSEMSRNLSNSSDATLVDMDAGADRKGQTVDCGNKSDGGLIAWLRSTCIVDLGESIVGASNASNARINGTRVDVPEYDADFRTPIRVSEDGYMAESESFDDSDHVKSGGLVDSESFGAFVGGTP